MGTEHHLSSPCVSGVVGLCFIEGSVVNVDDVFKDARYSAKHDRHCFSPHQLSKAMLAIPIKTGRRVTAC